MSLFNDLMKNLNEAAEVKKPYGDKPEEGKVEKVKKGKSASIPKGKANNKFKVTKLKNVNKQAVDAYANDTEKVMDNIDDKKHSDKGKVAKVNSKKADRKVKYPFGDKVETPSDNKLIKESEEVEETEVKECGANCGKKEGFKALKEDYDNETWLKHQNAIEAEIDAAKEDMEADAFEDFCEGIINYCKNCTGEFDQFECAKSDK